MNILKKKWFIWKFWKKWGSREKGGGGNEIHAPCTCDSKLETCVKLKGEFSEFFSGNVGLIQGQSLSPFLYSIYVNEIEIELIKQGMEPYDVKMLNLYLFMHADDTVLFSESITELQKWLTLLINVRSNMGYK